MSNDDVARVLAETADLIELTDGNPYRARAFQRAARALQNLDASAGDRLENDTLTEVSGIGDNMADHVADVLDSGTFPLHDELLNAVPPGLLDVLRVNGLGTKRTRRLWQELGITSLDDLEAAAAADRIAALDGFGDKTQQNIRENVQQLRAYESQWRLNEAWSAVTSLLDDLRATDAVERAEPSGALRRRCETIEQAAVVVSTSRPEAVQNAATALLAEASDTKVDVVDGTLPNGLPVRLRITSPDCFGTTWWRTTGSAAHREAFTDRFGAPADHPTEDALFSTVDLPHVPPELREDRGELAAAAQNALPTLLTTEDLRGCLHNHSTYSDGSDTLRNMAAAARAKGFTYFGICDHSQSLRIADGLSPEEVAAQQEEIAQINQELDDEGADFRVFSGIESDIHQDGSLDYDEEVLASFDFVVASVHTGFSMTEDEATERVVRAIQNPYTRILGHPTGRLLLSRDGYPLDHVRVIEACAEADVALELNANPHRLDLDWRWVRRATEAGVLISINPDAHATGEIDHVKWGVSVGRKGWLTPEQCLNARPRSAFVDWLNGSSS